MCQLEEGKKETERLKTQFENERKRRWRILEEKADVEQVVRELYGWEEASSGNGGKKTGIALLSSDDGGGESVGSGPVTLPVPVGGDLSVWVSKYRQSVALMQTVKEKRCVWR